MALSLSEQLQIINNQVAPPAVSMSELVAAASYAYAIDFLENHKIVDPVTSPLANNYLDLMVGMAGQVLRGSDRTYDVLKRTLIARLAGTSVTMAQIQGATQSQWENFVSNNMPRVFEYVAGVRKEQRNEYQALS